MKENSDGFLWVPVLCCSMSRRYGFCALPFLQKARFDDTLLRTSLSSPVFWDVYVQLESV